MNKSNTHMLRIVISFLVLANFSVKSSETKAQIESKIVRAGIYVLTGPGGNMGVSTGPDGVFLVDAKYAKLYNEIESVIAKLSHKPVKFVVNTHWHVDHVSGNQNFSDSGAIIVAHRNTKKRIENRQLSKLSNMQAKTHLDVDIPFITYTDELEFHFNGENIKIIHMKNAHTDGDSLVWFKESNVIHMGDLFRLGSIPVVDTRSGGLISGMIKAVDWVLNIADENTLIIPGHGNLSNKYELVAYREVLVNLKRSENK